MNCYDPSLGKWHHLQGERVKLYGNPRKLNFENLTFYAGEFFDKWWGHEVALSGTAFDTKGWSCQNRFGDIARTICNLRREHVLEELVELTCLGQTMQKRVPKTNRPRKVRRTFAGHICGGSFGTKFNLQYRIGNCDEGANVSLFWMGDPDCVLQKLRNGKDGLVAEMLKYGRVETKQYSLGLFMDMVKAYHLESSRCHSSLAALLSKLGKVPK